MDKEYFDRIESAYKDARTNLHDAAVLLAQAQKDFALAAQEYEEQEREFTEAVNGWSGLEDEYDK